VSTVSTTPGAPTNGRRGQHPDPALDYGDTVENTRTWWQASKTGTCGRTTGRPAAALEDEFGQRVYR
jgi:hypothetical protein